MDMFEEARALYGTVRMCGLSQAELARKLGVSQSYVANKLRLLRYSTAEQEMIVDGGLSERHARALLRITDRDLLDRAIRQVCAGRLTVAKTEELVDDLLDGKMGGHGAARKIADLTEGIDRAVEGLRTLGVRAEKRVSESRGGITIFISVRY